MVMLCFNQGNTTHNCNGRHLAFLFLRRILAPPHFANSPLLCWQAFRLGILPVLRAGRAHCRIVPCVAKRRGSPAHGGMLASDGSVCVRSAHLIVQGMLARMTRSLMRTWWGRPDSRSWSSPPEWRHASTRHAWQHLTHAPRLRQSLQADPAPLILSAAVPAVVGFPWLATHNPRIDWSSGTLSTWSVVWHSHCLRSTLPPILWTQSPIPRRWSSPEFCRSTTTSGRFCKLWALSLPPHQPYDCALTCGRVARSHPASSTTSPDWNVTWWRVTSVSHWPPVWLSRLLPRWGRGFSSLRRRMAPPAPLMTIAAWTRSPSRTNIRAVPEGTDLHEVGSPERLSLPSDPQQGRMDDGLRDTSLDIFRTRWCHLDSLTRRRCSRRLSMMSSRTCWTSSSLCIWMIFRFSLRQRGKTCNMSVWFWDICWTTVCLSRWRRANSTWPRCLSCCL